jgi:hypothetical protein
VVVERRLGLRAVPVAVHVAVRVAVPVAVRVALGPVRLDLFRQVEAPRGPPVVSVGVALLASLVVFPAAELQLWI